MNHLYFSPYPEESQSGVYTISEENMKPKVMVALLEWMYLRRFTIPQTFLVVSTCFHILHVTIPNPHSWWAGLSVSIADLGSGIRWLFEPLDLGFGIKFFQIPDPQSICLIA
jgi:hypothetical protein